MIRPGFLSKAERNELRALARDGRSEGRIVRRANAVVLLNDGWSCAEVATALLLDDDTVRRWPEHGSLRPMALITAVLASLHFCIDWIWTIASPRRCHAS